MEGPILNMGTEDISNEIVILIKQGAIVDVDKPHNVGRIVIRDYDVQETDRPDIKQDDDGEYYQEIIWE